MIFYKRYVARIQIATGHLTPCEFGVYDRLLDHYYAKEEPLPAELSRCCAIAGAQTKTDRVAVAAVLDEFFEQDDAGRWHQKTANEVIAEARPKIQAARENGKLGGRPSKAKLAVRAAIVEPIGLLDGTETDPNGEARQRHRQSTTSVPNGTDADGVAPARPLDRRQQADKVLITDPDEIIFGYGVPLLTVAGSEDKHARSFLGGLRKVHGDVALIDALRRCVREKPMQPLEWLAAALPPKPGKGKQSAVESRNAAVVDALIGDTA